MLKPFRGDKPLPVNQRPDCRNCGKKLRPQIWGVYEHALSQREIAREFTGTYGYADLFCSKECGYRFGVAAALSGYRHAH